jgi:hypothetical protein
MLADFRLIAATLMPLFAIDYAIDAFVDIEPLRCH